MEEPRVNSVDRTFANENSIYSSNQSLHKNLMTNILTTPVINRRSND